jgi:hypothetical protein
LFWEGIWRKVPFFFLKEGGRLSYKDPAKKAALDKQRRQKRIDEGKCAYGGKCERPIAPGKQGCRFHLDQQNVKKGILKAKRRAAGACHTCGSTLLFDETRCKDCCLYNEFRGMHTRCNPTYKDRHRYYDMEVHVDPEWLDTPEGLANFKRDMGPTYFPHAHQDRHYDKFGDYGPKNSKWVTQKENNQNVRTIAEVGKRKDEIIASLRVELEQRKEPQNV